MWYVIEHFEDMGKALRKAASLLRAGGILALSTPSLEGASGRFDRKNFFARSPEDHFTLWEPSRTRAMLKAYGFRVERIRSTGHHPERLPGLRFLASREGRKPLGGLLAGAGRLISRAFALGDTFEIYAIREEQGDVLRKDARQAVVNSDILAQGASPDAEIERGAIRGPNGS
jgi:hypothetical protein